MDDFEESSLCPSRRPQWSTHTDRQPRRTEERRKALDSTTEHKIFCFFLSVRAGGSAGGGNRLHLCKCDRCRIGRFWRWFVRFWSLALQKNAHHSFPEPKASSPKLLLLSNQPSKTQRRFIYYHKVQRKAVNPNMSYHGTSNCLTRSLENWSRLLN